jgi:hypothetical protein
MPVGVVPPLKLKDLSYRKKPTKSKALPFTNRI